MSDVINRGSCPPWAEPEACLPFTIASQRGLLGVVNRLTRSELEDLALRFYGRNPARFEQLLLEMWARRKPSTSVVRERSASGG